MMGYAGDIVNIDSNEHISYKEFGGKFFYSFQKNDNEYIFKHCKRSNISVFPLAGTTLSEVFHSKLGTYLGIPCADNKLARISIHGSTEHGLVSKNFLKTNENFKSIRRIVSDDNQFRYLESAREFQNISLPEANESIMELVIKEQAKTSALSRIAHFLNIGSIDKQAFGQSLANNFLMAHVSQNTDMEFLHNTGIVFPRQTMSPCFDFEFAKDFCDLTQNNYRIHPSNVNFLKQTQPELVNSFVNAMQTTQKSLQSLCDFTDTADFWNKFSQDSDYTKKGTSVENQLADLSASVYSSYSARLERLGNSLC